MNLLCNDPKLYSAVPLLSTPLSPKSRRRVSPIKTISEENLMATSDSMTTVSNLSPFLTPTGKKRPKATPASVDSCSTVTSRLISLNSIRQPFNSALRTPDRNVGHAGQSGCHQRTPMNNIQNTRPHGYGHVNSSSKSSRDSGFGSSCGNQNRSSNCENSTPRFLNSNLMSPYFPDRKWNT